MNNKIIKVHGALLPDTRRGESYQDTKYYLETHEDFEFVQDENGTIEYVYFGMYVDARKTILYYDEKGRFLKMEHEGLESLNV